MKDESHNVKHTRKKKSHSKKKDVTVSKSAVWMVFTLIFAILFVVSLLGVFGGNGSQSTLSDESISNKVVNSINLIQVGLNPTVSSVERMPDGIYKVEVEVQGQKLSGYVSPNGELFFPQAFTTEGTPAPTQADDRNNNATQAAPTQVNLEGAHILGDEDAPVTLVEWSDFECPFCSKWYTQIKGLIEKDYIDTGKVKLVYKHFPIDNIHPMARPAALASECAAEQDKFWEYHDMIFENQASLSADNLKIWAGDLGLDQDQFDGCLDSGKYNAQVEADLKEGAAAGVTGTPSFIIGGQLISGVQPYKVFKAALDTALG